MTALSASDRAALEARVDAALSEGKTRDALAQLVTGYGPELLTFLHAVHGEPDAAADVFSQTCEDLVRTFDRFRRECSFRTWVYALARNASRRHLEDSPAKRKVRLSQASDVEQARRTTTAAFLRTDWKSRFRALRDTLEPEDRAILVLRVDREMSWDDIATVLASEGSKALTPAALRKRFERIKATLKEHASASGWLEQ